MATYKADITGCRPAGISETVWQELHKNPQCSRLGTICETPCCLYPDGETYGPVEVEHLQALAEGGDDDPFNIRWLCKHPNLVKGAGSDVEWSRDLYFDQQINFDKLRPHQARLYEKICRDYRSHYLDTTALVRRFQLLAWMMGAGKTVGMMAAFTAINNVRKSRGAAVRRIKRVLWLVHQQVLVEQLHREISTEFAIHGIGLNPAKSAVEMITHAGAWNFPDAEIFIACPQALWPDDSRLLTPGQRNAILGRFDAIVVDEAQFAVDKYIEICEQAPLALKFAITATPMDKDGALFCEMDNGRYRDRFVLLDVFDYHTGFEQTPRIFKKLLPFADGAKGSQYVEVNGGQAVEVCNGEPVTVEATNLKSQSRLNAVIGEARRKAVAADRRTPYCNQVMIRCASIRQAKHVAKIIEADVDDACAVYTGSGKPHLGSETHAWMLVKKNGGQFKRTCKRIVICVDIGQFGINNPYCSIIAWADVSYSMIEIIQRLGRALRAAGSKNEQVQIVWDGLEGERFREVLSDSIEFILNYAERMLMFPSFDEMSTVGEHCVTPLLTRLPKEDQIWIIDNLGRRKAQGTDLGTIDLDEVVDDYITCYGEQTPNRADAIRKFVEQVTEPDAIERIYKPHVLWLTARIVREEDPYTAGYTPELLIGALERGEIGALLTDDLRQLKAQRIREGDVLSLFETKSELEQIHKRERELAAKTYIDHGTILRGSRPDYPEGSYASTLLKQLTPTYQRTTGSTDTRELRSNIVRVVQRQTARYFGLKNVQEDYIKGNGLSLQLSHALTREEHRQIILHRSELHMYAWRPDWFAGCAEMTKGVRPAEQDEGEAA